MLDHLIMNVIRADSRIQAAEGIVNGRRIMEIKKYNIGVYLRIFRFLGL